MVYKKLKLQFGRKKQKEDAKNANRPSLTSLTMLLCFFLFLYKTGDNVTIFVQKEDAKNVNRPSLKFLESSYLYICRVDIFTKIDLFVKMGNEVSKS
jgi:hypothetical protein